MDILGKAHEILFERMLYPSENREEFRTRLKEMGITDEEINKLLSGGVREGTSYGGAHLSDLATLVQDALFTQRAKSITLKVELPDYEESGHLEIKVLRISPHNPQDETDVTLLTRAVRSMRETCANLRVVAENLLTLLDRKCPGLELGTEETVLRVMAGLEEINGSLSRAYEELREREVQNARQD
jgi:hypothetical protein